MHGRTSFPELHVSSDWAACYKCMPQWDALLCRKTFAVMHVLVGNCNWPLCGTAVCVCVNRCAYICACPYVLAEVSLEKPSTRTDLAVKKDNNLFIGIAQISLYPLHQVLGCYLGCLKLSLPPQVIDFSRHSGLQFRTPKDWDRNLWCDHCFSLN